MCSDNPDPCVICDEQSDRCLNEYCSLTPLACRGAAKSLLVIKNKDNDANDRMSWKFLQGAPTSFADFSDPRTSARYTFCLYAGTTATLVQEMSVPASATLWTASNDNRGYKYFDPPAVQDGAQKIILKASTSNRTKVLVKGHGVNLGDPINAGALRLPVTAQLVNMDSGACWAGTYSSPIKNSPDQFKAWQH